MSQVKKQAKHTPGPYYYEREQAERIAYAFRSNPDSAAELLHAIHEAYRSQVFAEMLEALKIARQTMDKYDDVGWSDGAIGLIDEVIAKAEERS